MQVIRWTFVTVPYKDGREVLHLHLTKPETKEDKKPWWKISPRSLIKSEKEAIALFKDILIGTDAQRAVDDEELLFKADKPIPKNAKVICWFDLTIDWTKTGNFTYRMGEYQRQEFSARYNPAWDCLVEVKQHLKQELKKRTTQK